jgi:hypothetical protein
MKNKVKMVLAYFRALGGSFYTDITFEYNRIESWDEKFIEVYGTRKIEPPKVIIDIFEELFNLYKGKINYFNDYDSDEIWYLTVDVKPEENLIRFTSECEYMESSQREFKGSVDDYDIQKGIKFFEEHYGLESELTIIFDGSWDDGKIIRISVDKTIPILDTWMDKVAWNIVNKIMTQEFVRYWNSNDGYTGEIKILKGREDLVIGDLEEKWREYNDTKMNIVITPDNVLEK